ncbi:MAG: hypothetical protein ABH867_00435 [Patescibacteria group bacterium]|nr:hypothetical protein [Patescibacteria group bacterium]
MKINQLKGRKILNSSGNWTVECFLKTSQGREVNASVPQGISTGKEERPPVEPEKAVEQIEKEIFPQITGKELKQEPLDRILTEGNWGANATLAVSAAFFKLVAHSTVKQLPKIMMLIFEGEAHGNPKLTIQEFMVIVDRVEKGVAFYRKVEKCLEKKGLLTTIGSEGGFSPKELNDHDVLDIMKKMSGENITLDIAGNINPPTIPDLLEIVRRYPIVGLEDPFPENKPEQWQEFFQKVTEVNPKILVVADDLTVTDAGKIKKGALDKLFNGVIIKPNQQGTITAAKNALLTAKNLGIKTIVSHRGEETNDNWIADFAVRFGADFVKFGAPARGERVAKYNRLLQLLKK